MTRAGELSDFLREVGASQTKLRNFMPMTLDELDCVRKMFAELLHSDFVNLADVDGIPSGFDCGVVIVSKLCRMVFVVLSQQRCV